MSGHSKWATIKHKKGAADAKRGKVFSRMSKELIVAARNGGSDVDMNPTLRTAVQKAKSANMPADNIERAIKKGAGEIEGLTYEEVVYEGYAAGGVGLVAVCLTDNKNRTAAEIRHIFGKQNSSFAAQGSVTRGFVRKGQIMIDASIIEEDKLMELALEAGAEDVQRDGEQFEVLTDPSAFSDVTEAFEKAEIATFSAEVNLVPTTYVPVVDKSVAKSVLRFVSDLEDSDDIQNVYTNMDMDDAVIESLAEED